MPSVFSLLQQTANYIKSKTLLQPKYGIILGTGLGNLTNKIQVHANISYADIPNFPTSTVESHLGHLIIGTLANKPVIAMQGRFHYYEGYTMQQIVFPVQVMKLLGITHIFISNAAGSLDPDCQPGDLMFITDHINLQPESPLRGQNINELGPRFPDMSQPYCPELLKKAIEIAQQHHINWHKGTYTCVSGPQLETKAEYEYLYRIGSKAVGMSTVPEVIAAVHCGLKVFALSLITDCNYPTENIKPLLLEDVIAIATKAEPKLTLIISELIAGL